MASSTSNALPSPHVPAFSTAGAVAEAPTAEPALTTTNLSHTYPPPARPAVSPVVEGVEGGPACGGRFKKIIKAVTTALKLVAAAVSVCMAFSDEIDLGGDQVDE
ncbi:hypothetical protein AURDEDRAFT_164358 [Auricularia subglabra TFB-10046 SS5]|nr:hypothetical protein AURDEDRAFT_164358 [Auricularia subglabra TFB-10046 SS5]